MYYTIDLMLVNLEEQVGFKLKYFSLTCSFFLIIIFTTLLPLHALLEPKYQSESVSVKQHCPTIDKLSK